MPLLPVQTVTVVRKNLLEQMIIARNMPLLPLQTVTVVRNNLLEQMIIARSMPLLSSTTNLVTYGGLHAHRLYQRFMSNLVWRAAQWGQEHYSVKTH